MNHKDESSLELEAIIAALVPALQFATLWNTASSYHPTQALSTTETVGNRRSIALFLQDISMAARVCLHCSLSVGPKSQSNLRSCFPLRVAANDLTVSVWIWASHEGGCKDFLERHYPIFHKHQVVISYPVCGGI